MCAGGGGSRCEWILQALMWAMVCSFGLADPADALIRLFGGFAQFAVGGLLVRGDHSLADVSLVGDPSGGVQAVEQSGRRLVRPRRAWTRGRGPRPTRACRRAGPGSEAFMPVVLCSPRPWFAVSAPTPAEEEGPSSTTVAALGHLLGREQHVPQGPGRSPRS